MGVLHAPRDPGGFRPRLLPPVWAALVAVAMVAASHLKPEPTIPGPELQVAAPLFAVAVLLATWTVVMFITADTAIEPGRVASKLIRDGPFRLSRNPIYLAMVIALLGLAVTLDTLISLLGVPIFAVIITRRVIRHEERMLQERFGVAYEAYRSEVRRWL